MPLVGEFSRGSPVSPALTFRHFSILIGSQDLDLGIQAAGKHTSRATDLSSTGSDVMGGSDRQRREYLLCRHTTHKQPTHCSKGMIKTQELPGAKCGLVPGICRAAMTRRLEYSPPIKAHRVRFPLGSLSDFRTGNRAGRCSLVGSFFRDLPFPPRALATPPSQRNTALLARRSDEALGVRVSVARIAPLLLNYLPWTRNSIPRELSDFDKGVIVGCYLIRLSSRAIARKLNRPKSTAAFVLRKWKVDGHCANAARSGRPPILTDRNRRTLKREIQQEYRFPLEHCVQRPTDLDISEEQLHISQILRQAIKLGDSGGVCTVATGHWSSGNRFRGVMSRAFALFRSDERVRV
ncbi:hypothetical protein PR048_025127 [Dryococelus australis]|uniref:Uncharacterized protein n=1 Tax=Dryococelus australis TaxID=614101 RepID=A0ABQ9GQJ4_9NEOP|nr:hypothetical protein PR048_025127 [Dryococelus australis]